MTASASFDPGSGWLPGTPLPGGRDQDRRAVRQARRQALRQLGADARMGLGPAVPVAWLGPEEPLAGDGPGSARRRPRPRRVLTVAALTALAVAVALPQLAESVEPMPTALPTADEVARVLADDAGHRLDRGNVREVEVGSDGTVWLAVGGRVLALGTPGSTQPRTRGWEAFPRRLAVQSDGALWAIEDGGEAVVLSEDGWIARGPDLPPAADPLALDEAALGQLRAAGIEHAPRVVAGVSWPDGRRWLVVDVGERSDARPAEHRLLRSDGSSWTVLGPEQGLPQDTRVAWTAPGPQAPVALTVDHLGRAWFSLEADGLWLADDDGIHRVHFPGLGSGALDLAATAEGAVWIASARGALFRWSPEEGAAL